MLVMFPCTTHYQDNLLFHVFHVIYKYMYLETCYQHQNNDITNGHVSADLANKTCHYCIYT